MGSVASLLYCARRSTPRAINTSNLVEWNPADVLRPLRAVVTVAIEGRPMGLAVVPRGEPLGRIAYFSMEVGIDPRLPIYRGGLGVLAGDTLRSFADLRLSGEGPDPADLPRGQGGEARGRGRVSRGVRHRARPAAHLLSVDLWLNTPLRPLEASGTSFNGSFFHTHRMVQQYATNAYV